MFFPASLTVHPVIFFAPDRIGWAPAAACQTTGWPAVPESVASNPSVAPSAYVPSPSSTTAARGGAPARPRPAVGAGGRERAPAPKRVFPPPAGETKR